MPITCNVCGALMQKGILFRPWPTDADSPRTRELVRSYDEYDFHPDHTLFGDLNVYIRKE